MKQMNTKTMYYIIQLLEGFGMGAFFPVYTRYMESYGLSFFKMGFVNFIFHIVSAVLDPFTGYIADRFGKRNSFIAGQLLWTTTQYIYAASSSIEGFILAEVIAAGGYSLKSDALESWMINRLGEKEASKTMGKSKTLFTIGQISSAILSGYIADMYSMKVSFVLSGTLFLLGTLIGWTILYRHDPNLEVVRKNAKEEYPMSVGQILSEISKHKDIRHTMVNIFAFSFVSRSIFMYWPQVSLKLGVTEKLLGWIILAISLPSMLGSLLAGHNIIFQRNKIGLAKILVITGISLILAGVTKNFWIFIISLSIMEISYGAIRISTYGTIDVYIESQNRATINSIMSSIKTLGGAIALLVMGALSDRLTPQITWVISGIIAITTVILFKIRREI